MPVYFGIDLYRSTSVTATETMYFKNLLATQDPCDVGVNCTCGSGLTTCGSQCVDTSSDPSNCGGCGLVCTGGRACVSSACTCAAGQSFCSGQCVSTQTDNSNCGGCGVVCGSGQTCSAGVCTGGSAGTRLSGTDVNGDRKGDFVARDAAGNLYVFTSNGTVLSNTASSTSWYTDTAGWSSGNRFYPLDVNGDGKTDLVARGANGTFEVSLSNGSAIVFDHSFTSGFSDANGWNGGNQFFIGDIDGDGKGDLFVRQGDGGIQLLISDGSKLVSRATVATPYTYAAGWASGNRFYPLDINGDGKCDLLARNANGTFDVWISSGRNLTQSGSFTTYYTDVGGWSTGLRFFVVDINGDGKGDLLARGSNGNFDVLLSNGSVLTTSNPSFATYFTDTNGWNSGNRFLARDVDGDGRTDLLMRGANGTFEAWLSNGAVLTNGHPSTTSNLTDANGWNDGLRFF